MSGIADDCYGETQISEESKAAFAKNKPLDTFNLFN